MVSQRNIFLFIRGVDQSGRAFNLVDRAIDKMIKKEMEMYNVTEKVAKKQLEDQIKLMKSVEQLGNSFQRLIFAGGAFSLFSAVLAGGIGMILERSETGKGIMEDFGLAVDKFLNVLSENIVKRWGDFFHDVIEWVEDLSKNDLFMDIISGAAIPVTLTLGIMGISLIAVGIIGTFITKLISFLLFAGWISADQLVAATVYGKIGLSVALPLVAVLGLSLLWEYSEPIGNWIKENITDPIKKWWDDMTQEIRDNAEMGGGLIDQILNQLGKWLFPEGSFQAWNNPTGKQTGTTGIAKTGLYMMHEGEMVFNPQQPITPPLQMMGGGRVSGVTSITINNYIDNIANEADENRLVNKMMDKIQYEMMRR